VERAPRERRSLYILSVKKEAKLSASEVNYLEKTEVMQICDKVTYLQFARDDRGCQKQKSLD